MYIVSTTCVRGDMIAFFDYVFFFFWLRYSWFLFWLLVWSRICNLKEQPQKGLTESLLHIIYHFIVMIHYVVYVRSVRGIFIIHPILLMSDSVAIIQTSYHFSRHNPVTGRKEVDRISQIRLKWLNYGMDNISAVIEWINLQIISIGLFVYKLALTWFSFFVDFNIKWRLLETQPNEMTCLAI